MSKKALRITVTVLSAVMMLGAAAGFYAVESERTTSVSENQSYIYCADRTLALAESAGVADKQPSSHAADTKNMSKMQADLSWLADYDTELSRLDRAYDELSTSPAVKQGESYAQACMSAADYHQIKVDEANDNAAVLSAVCIVLFAVGLTGAILPQFMIKDKEN